jgi:hypothetical protein
VTLRTGQLPASQGRDREALGFDRQAARGPFEYVPCARAHDQRVPAPNQHPGGRFGQWLVLEGYGGERTQHGSPPVPHNQGRWRRRCPSVRYREGQGDLVHLLGHLGHR